MKRLMVVFLLAGASLACAQVQWGPDINLTDTSGSAYTTGHGWCMATDTSGKVHVTWADTRNISGAIYYKMGSDTLWSSDSLLAFDPALSNLDPNLDIDFLGAIHVIWWFMNTDVAELWYRQKRSTGWDPSVLVERGIYPTARVDRTGNFHVIYVRPDSTLMNPRVTYQMRDNLSGWQPRETLTGDTVAVWSTCITLDHSGKVHVVFLSNGNIFYLVKVNGLWSPTLQLTSGGTSVHPQVVSDSLSNIHLIWSDTRDGGRAELYYKMKDASGWLSDRRLTFTPGSSDSASLAVDDSQHVHVVWVDSTAGLSRPQLFYMTKRDTQWSTPQQLTNATQGNRRSPVITADRKGKLHVIWSDSRDGQQAWQYDLYYKETAEPSAVEDKTWRAGPSKTVGPLRILPNPFTSFTTLPGRSSERFALYDIAGRRVGTYRGGRIGEGLAAGVYFIRSADQASKPLRIVKLR